MILRDFRCRFVNLETAILDERCHLVDICAPIKVSCDLSQDALEISSVHVTCGKTTVNSHCVQMLSEMEPPIKKHHKILIFL